MDKEKSIIGYWISEKKQQKLNWKEFKNICEQKGFVLKKINLDGNLDSQGPFHVFLHKLTDTLALAERGDQNAKRIVTKAQEYLYQHPEMILIDPFENVKNLNNRQQSYLMLHKEIKSSDIFVPKTIQLKSENADENLKSLRSADIRFPFISKPLFAHGSSDAHKMMIIFNEKDLMDCQLPCVAQDFINHNAVLHKVFIVGKYFHVVERPSLRNFYPIDCEQLSTLFFSSHDISKSGSKSQWSVISKEDKALRIEPNHEIIQYIVAKVTKIFGLTLLGIDVVIENHTGKYAIIDVNVFPGYDGYPHFFTHLIDTITNFITERRVNHNLDCSILKKCNEELDSGFESDDKKKKPIK
ncbi:inositol-tetrakisphosphate 1-kinase isoform X2 [Cotesia typhae]|uniref:inositol-tetrakisphosphate 1-kinase isoform X2 n=1 Tax=Cotesia typhae TaxID=2053667 RepID=UPI003D68F2D0